MKRKVFLLVIIVLMVTGWGKKEENKANLNSFVKELKTSLLDKDSNYLLTMAVHGTPLGDNRYDYGYLNEYIDFYNVMSYDANLDDVTSHLCPLYKNEIDSRNYSIDEAYHKLIKKIPNEKIIYNGCSLFYGCNNVSSNPPARRK